jgi:hypothetical protein
MTRSKRLVAALAVLSALSRNSAAEVQSMSLRSFGPDCSGSAKPLGRIVAKPQKCPSVSRAVALHARPAPNIRNLFNTFP